MSASPEASPQALPKAFEGRHGSGAYRIDLPRGAAELANDWDRLVAMWEAQGYDDTPPKCMAEYADAVIEALSA